MRKVNSYSSGRSFSRPSRFGEWCIVHLIDEERIGNRGRGEELLFLMLCLLSGIIASSVSAYS